MRLAEGSRIPKGYGMAWMEPDIEQYVCLPVPVNILAAVARRVWHWLIHGLAPFIVDRKVADARREGFIAGVASQQARLLAALINTEEKR
jgi:hypothetical protein